MCVYVCLKGFSEGAVSDGGREHLDLGDGLLDHVLLEPLPALPAALLLDLDRAEELQPEDRRLGHAQALLWLLLLGWLDGPGLGLAGHQLLARIALLVVVLAALGRQAAAARGVRGRARLLRLLGLLRLQGLGLVLGLWGAQG